VLRIALVQINLYNNKAKAVEYALKLLKKLGLSDSDIDAYQNYSIQK
jgi:hypothetical protein